LAKVDQVAAVEVYQHVNLILARTTFDRDYRRFVSRSP